MGKLLLPLFVLVIYAGAVVGWIGEILHNLVRENILWLAAEAFLGPVGAIHFWGRLAGLLP